MNLFGQECGNRYLYLGIDGIKLLVLDNIANYLYIVLLDLTDCYERNRYHGAEFGQTIELEHLSS